jgi:hypothetical protein
MHRFALSLAIVVVTALCVPACAPPPPGVGEGEGDVGEGEGDVGEGEGEGDVGEGEGEGDVGEGEGDVGEGEGEGEGELGPVCAHDDDCASPLVCTFVTGGPVLETHCGAAHAGSAAGAPCSTGATCARGLCNGGQCADPCVDNNDCTAGQICGTSSITVNGTGGVLDVCGPNFDLPPTACTHDADCTALGQLCVDVTQDNAGNLSFTCGTPPAGAAVFGAACGSQSLVDPDCATGLCDGVQDGRCTRSCTGNADCGGSEICSGSGFTNVDIRLCAQACVRESDCGAGRSCTLRDDVGVNRLDQVCAPASGALAAGAPTNDAGQCTSAFAITDGNGTFCTFMCSTNGDCPNAAPTCGPLTVNKPDGGTQTVNVCLR